MNCNGRRHRSFAVLLALFALLSLSASVLADVRKKEPKKDPEKKPAVEPKAGAPAPKDEFVKRLELRLGEWERAAAPLRIDGLTVEGFLAPDALAYKAARTYLDQRKHGYSHDKAAERVARLLPRWKRYRGTSLFVIRMRNTGYRRDADNVQIITQTKNLTRDAILVRDARKRRIATKIAGLPLNLRQAKLRVRKFWVVRDSGDSAISRRQRGGVIVGGSSRTTREPKLSKPFNALVLEKNPAEIELLAKRATLEKSKSRVFDVELAHWKRYVGPFAANQIDLNEEREWSEIDDLDLAVRLPPAGFRVAPELADFLRSLEEAAAAQQAAK